MAQCGSVSSDYLYLYLLTFLKRKGFHGARIRIRIANADLDPGKATSMRIRILHRRYSKLSKFVKNSTKKCEQYKKLTIIPKTVQAVNFSKGEKRQRVDHIDEKKIK
jgi:hypothetical protein